MDILCTYCGRRPQLARQCYVHQIWYCLGCSREHELDAHVDARAYAALAEDEQARYDLYHHDAVEELAEK